MGLSQIRGERLRSLWSFHGAGIVDISLCHSGGYAVCKISALFQGRLKGTSADGIAGLSGHSTYGILGKLPANSTCQTT